MYLTKLKTYATFTNYYTNTDKLNSCYIFFFNSFDLPEEWHEVN